MEISIGALMPGPRITVQRFKSFRGAQPPRKLRWTNAGVFGVMRRYGDFNRGA